MVVLGNRFEFIKFIEWFLIIDEWKPKNLGPSRVGLKVSSDRKAWLGLEARKYVIASKFLVVFSLFDDSFMFDSQFHFGFLSKLFGLLASISVQRNVTHFECGGVHSAYQLNVANF